MEIIAISIINGNGSKKAHLSKINDPCNTEVLYIKYIKSNPSMTNFGNAAKCCSLVMMIPMGNKIVKQQISKI